MDKFLQEFKDNLESQTPPDFEPQDWADMQQRLAVQQSTPKSKRRYLTAIAALLLLCSLGFNWFVYGKFQEVNDKIANLEFRKDSVIQTKVIYQTDTIYKTNTIYINKNSTVNAHLETSPGAVAEVYNKSSFLRRGASLWSPNMQWKPDIERPQGYAHTYDEIIENGSLLHPFYIKNQTGYFQQNESEIPTEIVLGSVTFLASIPLSKLVFSEHSLPPLTVEEITEPKKKSLVQKLYPLRPKGIGVGANLSAGITFSDNYQDFHIFQTGLIGSVKFSDALRLTGRASISNMNYSAEEMGEQNGVPVIPFPNDDYKLEGIKINRNMWSADIGMEYSFFTKKQWQPFIGASFGVSSLTKNEVNYEFENKIIDEYFFEKRNYKKAKNLQYTRFTAGIAYWINKKWRVQLAGDYVYRLQNFNNQVPDNANIGLNVLYDF